MPTGIRDKLSNIWAHVKGHEKTRSAIFTVRGEYGVGPDKSTWLEAEKTGKDRYKLTDVTFFPHDGYSLFGSSYNKEVRGTDFSKLQAEERINKYNEEHSRAIELMENGTSKDGYDQTLAKVQNGWDFGKDRAPAEPRYTQMPSF